MNTSISIWISAIALLFSIASVFFVWFNGRASRLSSMLSLRKERIEIYMILLERRIFLDRAIHGDNPAASLDIDDLQEYLELAGLCFSKNMNKSFRDLYLEAKTYDRFYDDIPRSEDDHFSQNSYDAAIRDLSDQNKLVLGALDRVIAGMRDEIRQGVDISFALFAR